MNGVIIRTNNIKVAPAMLVHSGARSLHNGGATMSNNNTNVSGVYKIVNIINGKFYIGSSKDMPVRFTQHLSMLRGGYHKNKHLQSAFKKYGEAAFTFSVLLECPVQELIIREQDAIDNLKPQYNGSRIAGKVEMTAAVRARLSQANLGVKRSIEFCKKISASLVGNTRTKGWIMPAELRKRLSLIRKGKNKGRVVSQEVREKISMSLTGKKQSEETKIKKSAAVSLAKIGHTTSSETRQKISNSLKGRVLSQETKDRMRVGQIERWEKSKDDGA